MLESETNQLLEELGLITQDLWKEKPVMFWVKDPSQGIIVP